MCGIAGFIYKNREQPAEESRVRAMCSRIRHRGPDDEGILVDGALAMGMRRLSIVDLDGGAQPIFNEDGSIAVVYNGEVYNYPELRRELEGAGHHFRTDADTEVLVHGYESWGDDLPTHLNGMFAFGLWDARSRRLLLARDHVGIKPLYLFEDTTMLAFASEVKALLVLPEVERTLDHTQLADFLTFGYTPAPGTLFKNVRKMAPASLLTIEGRRIETRSYWDLTFAPESRTTEDWCEELRSALDQTVHSQLMSDVPLGAFLSGGLDSSSIVASIQDRGSKGLSTYAIGFGRDDAFHNELDKAARVSRLFGTTHHEIVVEPNVADLIQPLIYHLDEPVIDTSFLVTYLVSKLARETATVILSGVGGDEVFAGYRRYLWPSLDQLYGVLPRTLDRGVIRPLLAAAPVDRGSSLKAALRYARGYLAHADDPPPERYQGYVEVFDRATLTEAVQFDNPSSDAGRTVAGYYESARADDPVWRMLYADLKTSLVDSLLLFTDKMSMAVSLEARVPLLDLRILELAARVPSELKLNGSRGLKHIFKLALEPRLPKEVIRQKKQGFGTPISSWFRGSLRPMVHDLLGPDRIGRRGLFRPEVVSRIIDEHMNQRADRSEHLLALLTLEVWQQVFIDGELADPPVLT